VYVIPSVFCDSFARISSPERKVKHFFVTIQSQAIFHKIS
jgi:hypothetical protein